ncbi:hypothetical protein LRR81_14065 [Metabacillus sp. GX 13764]|uniref:hypothetical protein n=1 Tax=Metabacillus kandeliae TaxID=2900151 RepID=UPI001E5A1624|nr:hypothetical protein [Metabacillus kandeliae]MCD7035366.1 hypothetical protein [Metabacillus kandeliae]
MTWKYTLSAEVWDGSNWIAKKLLTGSFSLRTPTKVFYIKDLGLKSGSNSVRIKGYFNRTDTGALETETTPAFIVKR